MWVIHKELRIRVISNFSTITLQTGRQWLPLENGNWDGEGWTPTFHDMLIEF